MDGLAGDGGRSPNSMRESQRLLMMDSRTLTFPEYVCVLASCGAPASAAVPIAAH